MVYIALIAIIYVFAFIITYEALGWWGHQEYQDQEDVIVGGLFYYFWKIFAKVSGLNPKKSYVTLGWIVATICYILPWIAAAIWALWQYWGPASIVVLPITIILVLALTDLFNAGLNKLPQSYELPEKYETNEIANEIADEIYEVRANESFLDNVEGFLYTINELSDSYETYKENISNLKIYIQNSNKDEKVKLNEFKLSTKDSQDKIYFKRGLIEYGIYPSRPNESIGWLNASINKNPNNETNLICRGFIFQESGDSENSYNDFKQACLLGSNAGIEFLLIEFGERFLKEIDNNEIFADRVADYAINNNLVGIDETNSKIFVKQYIDNQDENT